MSRTKSQKQESRVAKQCCGRVQAASGALDGAKGDVRNDKFLIECKTTDKDFFSLKEAVWKKIRGEAIKDGMRIPVLLIEIGDKEIAFLDAWNLFEFFGDFEVTETLKYLDNPKSIRIEICEEYPKIIMCFGGKYAIIEAGKILPYLRGEIIND